MSILITKNKYNYLLVEKTLELIKGQGDGRISEDDVNVLIEILKNKKILNKNDFNKINFDEAITVSSGLNNSYSKRIFSSIKKRAISSFLLFLLTSSSVYPIVSLDISNQSQLQIQ